MPEPVAATALGSELPILFLIALLAGLGERIPGLSAAGVVLLLGAYPRLLVVLSFAGSTEHATRPLLRALRAMIVLAALALGAYLGGLFELEASILGTPIIAGALFAAASCVIAVRYVGRTLTEHWKLALFALGLVLGFGLQLAEPPTAAGALLPSLMDAAVAAASLLVPGMGLERAVVVSGTYDALDQMLSSDRLWQAGVVVAVALLSLAFFARGLLDAQRRFPAAVEALLLGVLAGGLVRLWPWQLVSSYTLSAGGAQLAASARAVSPLTWGAHTGGEPSVVLVTLAMLASAVLTLVFCRRQFARALTPTSASLV